MRAFVSIAILKFEADLVLVYGTMARLDGRGARAGLAGQSRAVIWGAGGARPSPRGAAGETVYD